ncbi:MAG: hypothetical protein NT076_05610 [Candidatus Pacearchaeota archaeon]|nr:hypothetical protein [Candidatus Pacearchaeota archaeon]
MNVLLDTSFILDCLREKFDFTLAEEYGTMLLAEEVILELEKLAAGRNPNSDLARLALKIIDKNKSKFKMIELGNKYVDAGIVAYAKDKNLLVATMDSGLKKQLRKILVLRARKKLWVEN